MPLSLVPDSRAPPPVHPIRALSALTAAAVVLGVAVVGARAVRAVVHVAARGAAAELPGARADGAGERLAVPLRVLGGAGGLGLLEFSAAVALRRAQVLLVPVLNFE